MTQPTWETDRTSLAATLMTAGYDLVDLVWRPGSRLPGGYVCYFVFAWQPGIEESAGLFRRGAARVEPKTFSENYGTLRKRMYETRPTALPHAG